MQKQLIYNVEDDESIRELVKYALTAEGYEVISFESAEEMLDAVNVRMPSLILLDIMLPGMDGITALKNLRDTYKNVNLRIIMLTAKVSEINKVSGLNAGADDYLAKPFSVLELLARVKANLRKYAVELNSETLNFSGIELRLNSRELFADGKRINVTLKEFELMRILMLSANSVVSRETLLRDVWGYEYFGETRTLDIHVNTLREKLGAFGGCIVTVRGVGYSLKQKESGL